RPGRPLPEVEEALGRESSSCVNCGRAASEGHKCGHSAYCGKCGEEASLQGHGCGLSRFCPKCAEEAALAGHKCGETLFCLGCKMEVNRAHRHGRSEEERWGVIR
ncbi:MAG: hypothetical protein ACYTFG_09820, partial [Planctomycetota bacterium]